MSCHSLVYTLQATVKVHAQTDNVAGVKLPKFEQLDSGSGAKMNLTGLGAGGQQVQSTRKVRLPPRFCKHPDIREQRLAQAVR